MLHYYSRVPSSAVFPLFDGKLYVNIPHSVEGDSVTENFQTPHMMRFDGVDSFHKNGEAFVLFAKRGEAVPLKNAHVFYAVTIMAV